MRHSYTFFLQKKVATEATKICNRAEAKNSRIDFNCLSSTVKARSMSLTRAAVFRAGSATRLSIAIGRKYTGELRHGAHQGQGSSFASHREKIKSKGTKWTIELACVSSTRLLQEQTGSSIRYAKQFELANPSFTDVRSLSKQKWSHSST